MSAMGGDQPRDPPQVIAGILADLAIVAHEGGIWP
jgi:hypothetical protein